MNQNLLKQAAQPLPTVAAVCLADTDPKAVAAAADTKIPTRQLYVIGAHWCNPCKPVKGSAYALKKNGWDVSDTDMQALIAIVDFDVYSTTLLRNIQIETLPTILLIENGKEIQRLEKDEAHIDSYTMANLLLGPAQKDCEYKTPKGKLMIQKYQAPPPVKPVIPAVSHVAVPSTASALTLQSEPVKLPLLRNAIPALAQ